MNDRASYRIERLAAELRRLANAAAGAEAAFRAFAAAYVAHGPKRPNAYERRRMRGKAR